MLAFATYAGNMRVAIGGSTGLIGTALATRLREEGHDVVTLTRHEPSQPSDRRWDPSSLSIDPPYLDDVDAVVNLAGAPIAGSRWTDDYKDTLVSSRVNSTRLVVQALESSSRCRIFLSGSAVGFYGAHCGDRWLYEDDRSGSGFLAQVCRSWEEAAASAPQRVRVATLRTGQVISPSGGFLGKERPLFQFGLGGEVGNGRQYLSWISLDDHVSAMVKILTDDTITGPVNLTGPAPVTNAQFTKALAKALHRPAVVPFPTPIAKAVLGPELVDETICVGQRVKPAKLLDHGFEFRDTTIAESIASALAQRR